MTLPISERLWDLINSAVDEGMMMLQQDSLIPFALVMRKEGVSLQRFADVQIAIALEKAITTLRASDIEVLAYVLVYEVTIEMDEREVDALLIEAAERENSQAYRFARRYQTATAKMPPYAIGHLAYLGETDNYFAEL